VNLAGARPPDFWCATCADGPSDRRATHFQPRSDVIAFFCPEHAPPRAEGCYSMTYFAGYCTGAWIPNADAIHLVLLAAARTGVPA
jgi:hypothetical protein